MIERRRRLASGQSLVLFALLVGLILIPAVGVVIDGGNALSQRRSSQNASDFAALAGARVVAERIAGDTTNGTDANVQQAILSSINVTGGSITFGAPDGPAYVNQSGAVATCTGNSTGLVGGGTICSTAVGVKVASSRSWAPYFLGIVPGLGGDWVASTEATARGGYAAGAPGGAMFPVGIAQANFVGRQPCGAGVSTDPASPCYPMHMTPGTLNVPGGFGWLKFGADGKCTGFGLGQDPNSGCDTSKPFLQSEIGPPANSHGCCGPIEDTPDAERLIGSLPGNKHSADCSYYIDNKIVVFVPVWDYAGGTGANGWYHIVGYTGFQLTACEGGKDVEGIWRQPITTGRVTFTPGFAGAPLAVQLVH